MGTDIIAQVSPLFLGLVPLVLGLTSVVKLYVDSRWAPLFSLGLGIVGAFLVSPGETALGVKVISGIVVGLTSSGLYSGTKTVVAPMLNS